jgi:hypothetical protein
LDGGSAVWQIGKLYHYLATFLSIKPVLLIAFQHRAYSSHYATFADEGHDFGQGRAADAASEGGTERMEYVFG